MDGMSGRRNSLVTAAANKGNTVLHSDLIHEKPKKLQSSCENIFSIGYVESLFRSLTPPPEMRTCHHCGLFGSLRCSQCNQITYCSEDCRTKDWRAHRVVCVPIKQSVSNNNGGKSPAKTKKEVCLKDNSTSVDSLKTEEHIEKVMISDLQTLGIKKAMEVQGTIAEFKSLSEFYLQMNRPEVLDQISNLSVKLQNCYGNTIIQKKYIAIKGEVCVARCSLDQTWSRALVKDVDTFQKKAQVFFIDYGNEESVPLSCLRALHKDTELLLPPCVIKCSFANCCGKRKGWNEGIASFLSQMVGKQCSVTVVEILQEEMMLSFAVDVILPGFGDCLNKVPLEMRRDITPGSNDKAVGSPKVSENYSERSKEKIPEDEEIRADSVAECVSVCVGEAFSGVVSFIQNPNDFFCQQLCSSCPLADLQVSLNEQCDKFPSSVDFRPAVGDMCCAHFKEDNLWYRAAVLEYISEDVVLVVYIDYGNLEAVPLTRLRPMIPRLRDLPALAIRCTLAGVKPPLEFWTSKATSVMKQLVKNKVFMVKVVGKESVKCVVELVDTSVTPEMNLSSYLIKNGIAAEKLRTALPATATSDVKQAKGERRNKVFYKWNKLTAKQTVDVIVCTLYSPGEFYCHIANNNELLALSSLNKSLSEYCQQTPPNVSKPKNGEPYCAFFSGDGNWYRALVRNVTSDGTVKVYFVDYGNVEEVPLDKIRQISPSFLKLPFQGIKCWLSGTRPGNSKWIPEATERFHMYTNGIKLQARVTSISRNGAGVELIDNSTGHPKVINEILTSEKLAEKEVLQDKNNFPDKSVDEEETSLGHWKMIELAVGETIFVCVTEVVSPDLFYAVPVQTVDEEKLHNQLIELESYCKSCKNQSFKPKLGEACCARFSGDGCWYRALVLKASQSVVEVLYVDYGNTETVPLSRVLPITDSYLKLPFLTIICSLAGIERAEWSPLLLDKFKKMLLHKYVTITVKGIDGNVNRVTVEKQYENGSFSVADELIMEGLVKSCSAENLNTEHQGNGSKTKCCCAELKVQLKKHEQILLFLLNKYGNPDEMQSLLDH
ncbi:tudor domain-containing protein 1 [Colius striatus]|uniref:tudor domain-containing protein 1 n=1 Tax=Colius striatus TaxID=57412 RepID=UPI002B1D3E61|nr:tudor domain-containing protein 1 [Colius striatus]